MRKVLALVALVMALMAIAPQARATEREGRVADETPYEFVTPK